MPGVTLHLLLAERALDRWRLAPETAPFDALDEAPVNAFRQGAFGPDIGYFPGGQRFLSQLAHRVGTGDLCRALVRQARTPLERAFAWGWVTHVLGDQAVHPLIGRAVGELLHGDRQRFLEANENRPAHVRVEVGLDAWYAGELPHLRRVRTTPVFDRQSVSFLTGAYRETYGLNMADELLHDAHHIAVRRAAQGLLGTALLAHEVRRRRTPAAVRGARLLARTAHVFYGNARESLVLAFLNPVPPSEWLLECVAAVVEGFAPRFHRHYREDLEGLPNYNLDTGEVGEPRPSLTSVLRALGTVQKLAS